MLDYNGLSAIAQIGVDQFLAAARSDERVLPSHRMNQQAAMLVVVDVVARNAFGRVAFVFALAGVPLRPGCWLIYLLFSARGADEFRRPGV